MNVNLVSQILFSRIFFHSEQKWYELRHPVTLEKNKHSQSIVGNRFRRTHKYIEIFFSTFLVLGADFICSLTQKILQIINWPTRLTRQCHAHHQQLFLQKYQI